MNWGNGALSRQVFFSYRTSVFLLISIWTLFTQLFKYVLLWRLINNPKVLIFKHLFLSFIIFLNLTMSLQRTISNHVLSMMRRCISIELLQLWFFIEWNQLINHALSLSFQLFCCRCEMFNALGFLTTRLLCFNFEFANLDRLV